MASCEQNPLFRDMYLHLNHYEPYTKEDRRILAAIPRWFLDTYIDADTKGAAIMLGLTRRRHG